MDGWTHGQTDRWIFDVTERAAASNRNARMIYHHVSLFLNTDILKKKQNSFKLNYAKIRATGFFYSLMNIKI
jgi:hypothetical protein